MDGLLTIGDRGTAVGVIHQLLIESGERVDPGELAQAFFGPSTKIAVLDFQSSHLTVDGDHLHADGVVGPVTKAALLNPRAPVDVFIAKGWRGEVLSAPNDDARAAVAAAIVEIGVKEDPPGSNRGPRVDVYNGPDYLGAPWCANFASFCWSRAPNGSPFGKLASALKIKNWGAQNGKLLPADEALLPGDIGVIMRAEGRGHVEIITGCEFDGKISFIGGNVGNACRATVRTRDSFTHFVRPIR
jgi:hypothetical protein